MQRIIHRKMKIQLLRNLGTFFNWPSFIVFFVSLFSPLQADIHILLFTFHSCYHHVFLSICSFTFCFLLLSCVFFLLVIYVSVSNFLLICHINQIINRFIPLHRHYFSPVSCNFLCINYLIIFLCNFCSNQPSLIDFIRLHEHRKIITFIIFLSFFSFFLSFFLSFFYLYFCLKR